MPTILTTFGTRPEAIKTAPVVEAALKSSRPGTMATTPAITNTALASIDE